MCQCTGNCSCCPCLLVPTGISETDGITTITVASGVVTGLTKGEKVCIGFFHSTPNMTAGNIIKVTDGTTTLTVYNSGRYCNQYCNQYYRSGQLRYRNVLVLRYLNDPALLVHEVTKCY